ncbi:hypothetical protein NG796_06370 [Laspinema sp. A4]|uniref:hypothetical protein n=1 Tax=Laspinema sp. D2d TaxID=2953686 RepID=UPI0021BAD64C|nr:hypothetical protein [Laspinema sp. D2d]MCT7982913.1 hypothetical protein [Laspinema sp. D2d]
MPDSSNPSVETILPQNYISQTAAIVLLREVLQEESINEEIKHRILDQFSRNLEEYSHISDGLQDLSLTVISSLNSVKIIGPQGFQYKLGEVAQESLELLEGESIFQLHIYPLKECPDPIDCPVLLHPQIIIPHSGSDLKIDIIMMQNSQEVMLMGDPIDGPPSQDVIKDSPPGGFLLMDVIDGPPSPDPLDTPPTPTPKP